MASWLVQGLPPFDGRYEWGWSLDDLTTREWGWIKKYSGYKGLTIQQGLEEGDIELLACLAMISIRRAGRLETTEVAGFMERIQDEGFGKKITVDTTDATDAEQETVVLPPPTSSPSSTGISGDASPTSSENPGNGQKASGIPDWDSSVSHPQPWAS